MLTYLLALVNPASVVQQVLAVTFLTSVDWSPLCPALISWLTLSLDCNLLFCRLSPLDCPGNFFPLSSPGLMGGLARKPFVWDTRQNRQRDPLTGTYTHRNECHKSCHNIKVKYKWFLQGFEDRFPSSFPYVIAEYNISFWIAILDRY